MRPTPTDRTAPHSGIPHLDRVVPPEPDGTAADRASALRAAVSLADRGVFSTLLGDVLAIKRLIEARAYVKWVNKGRPVGTELEDWAEAEAELTRELNLPPTFAELGVQVRCWERDRRFQVAGHTLTQTLAAADGVDAAAPGCLRAAAAALGWKGAIFWAVEPRSDTLHCLAWWSSPADLAPTFEAHAWGCACARGVELPGRAWAEGRVVFTPDLTREDSPRAAAAAADGLRGGLAVPIRGNQRVWAVLELFDRDGRLTDEQDIELLEDLASQISQFAERRAAEAALQEQREERRVARLIQQGFLPKTPPVLPGFMAYGASYPAETVGGDYFDFVPMSGGSLGIVIGDVSGHGVGAALTMGQVRACMRALALTHTDPNTILGLCNRRLCEDLTSDVFVTMFLARLDAATRTLVYGNAGHWSGYVLAAGEEVKGVLESTGPPLGVVSGAEFPPAPPVHLDPGDLVLLFTDGITEATTPEGRPFGLQRALDVVRAHRHDHPSEITEALFRSVREYAGRPPDDDISAVVIRA